METNGFLCAGLTMLLIEHHGEQSGEEETEHDGASAEESPAPGMEAEAAEVCQSHKQHDSKNLPSSEVGLLTQGQGRPSTSLHLCRSSE